MYIKVKAFPKARQEEIREIAPDWFEIKVREKAEKNLANKRIIEIIARRFGVDERKVKIVNGHHHSSKLISIEN